MTNTGRDKAESFAAGRVREESVGRARAQLWLTLLDQPWDEVRQRLVAEMSKNRMSQEDLVVEMARAGYRVSQAAIGDWLHARAKKSPPYDAVKALVEVLARVVAGEWSKGQASW